MKLMTQMGYHPYLEALNKSPDARRSGLGWDGISRKRSDIGARVMEGGRGAPLDEDLTPEYPLRRQDKPEMDRARGFVQRFQLYG